MSRHGAFTRHHGWLSWLLLAAALALPGAGPAAAPANGALAGAAGAAEQAASAAQPEAADWPVAGRQGVVRLVIVPLAQASDAAAYQQQIQRLCAAGQTCFLNFYTNSANLPLTVPLPDAVSEQATAVFRRSMKQGAELLQWRCRLQRPEPGCF